MQMRAGDSAGAADFADVIALFKLIAFFYVYAAEMRINGL